MNLISRSVSAVAVALIVCSGCAQPHPPAKPTEHAYAEGAATPSASPSQVAVRSSPQIVRAKVDDASCESVGRANLKRATAIRRGIASTVYPKKIKTIAAAQVPYSTALKIMRLGEDLGPKPSRCVWLVTADGPIMTEGNPSLPVHIVQGYTIMIDPFGKGGASALGERSPSLITGRGLPSGLR